MGALTPALLLPAPEQVSLIHTHALQDIPSPTTPCASVPAMLLAPGGLGLRFALGASGGSSDFIHCTQSRQSHISRIEFVSQASQPTILRTIPSLPVALHTMSP